MLFAVSLVVVDERRGSFRDVDDMMIAKGRCEASHKRDW